MYIEIVQEKGLVRCPLRENSEEDRDKWVTTQWCEGCVFFVRFLHGGGGASSTAPIGAEPTKVDCKFGSVENSNRH